jgi:FkbM family methyltransferase
MALKDSLHARFPRAVGLYKRYVAPRIARDKRPYELSAWVSRGLELRPKVGFHALCLEPDGAWIRDRNGVYWTYTPGLFMSAGGAEFGLRHEAAEVEIVVERLPPDGVLVDVGANVGTYAIGVGLRRPDARIHAFEPVTATRTTLERNVAKNGLEGRIEIWPAAVGEAQGSARVTTTQTLCNHLLRSGEAAASDAYEDVEVVSLDDFLATRGARVDFLKCDIEGAELEVLRGAAGLIAACRPAILLEVDPRWAARYGHRPEDVFSWLEERGYGYQPIGDGDPRWGGDLGRDLMEANNFLFLPA